MARLATPKLIKSRQEVTIAGTLSATGTAVYTATIAPVKTDRTLVDLLTTAMGYYNTASNKYNYELGVELQNATTLKMTVTTTDVGGGPYGISFKVQVIELISKPKSLQTISGNGATSQTISQVDPAKAYIWKGYCHGVAWDSPITPSLGATAVTWNQTVPVAFRYQVVQFD